ncbi:hypothetical protein [Chitinophaga sp. YIM B06452]|uniref:hypothetical protein n=1 Tax=Chitinophaga sp. YIM B06452 TaxID=3082158 RepID=UPI0031FEB0DF
MMFFLPGRNTFEPPPFFSKKISPATQNALQFIRTTKIKMKERKRGAFLKAFVEAGIKEKGHLEKRPQFVTIL